MSRQNRFDWFSSQFRTSRKKSTSGTRRSLGSRQRKLRYEPLEDRRLLASDFWHGATAAGDYDHNGIVDGADFLGWQRSYGSEASLEADGNSNGIVDTSDRYKWQKNFGESVDLPTVDLHAGRLTITGSENDDIITLRQLDDALTIDGFLGKIPIDLVSEIVIHAGAGNDVIDLQGGEAAGIGSFYGTSSVYGGTGHDRIFGGRGVDDLFGGEGDDVLISMGADTLDGGAGEDIVYDNATTNSGYSTRVNAGDQVLLEYAQSQQLLNLSGSGETEMVERVTDVRYIDRQLEVDRADGTREVSFPVMDLPENTQSNVAILTAEQPVVPGGRGIIGNTASFGQINGIFANQNGLSAANSLLGSTGRIYSPGSLGSGILLALGGNQWVLTADHVINNKLASSITFRTTTGELRTVTEVYHRFYFAERDLALIKLSAPVPGVIGAVLPDYQAVSEGSQVIQAGFGISNNGTSGAFNFGFNTVDDFSNNTFSAVLDGELVTYQPDFVQFEYDQGEVATAPGDSGGPDIVPVQQINLDGDVLWIPSVIGIHSHGQQSIDLDGDGENDIPKPGDVTRSSQITHNISNIIRQIIPAEPEPTLVLEQLRVFENGDNDFPSGLGEWRYTITINGAQNHFFSQFSDESINLVQHVFHLGNNANINIAFSGVEEDGFLNGDDSLGFWSTTVTVPVRDFGLAREFFSSPVIHGDGLQSLLVFSIG